VEEISVAEQEEVEVVTVTAQFEFTAGLLLRIWLKQGKEKRLLARILKFLEKARKRLSRLNSTIKVRKCEREKRPGFHKKHTNFRNYNVLRENR
jgi:hypothetical protein